MKRLLTLCSLLLFPILAYGQSTTMSATVTDSNGQVWANGSYTVTFVPTPGLPNNYQWQGSQFQPQVYSGVLDATGSFTQVLPDNNTITPAGTQWLFVICPNATAPCSSITTPVTGTSESLTVLFSSRVTPPAIFSAPMPRAYSSNEVANPPPQQGGSFYQVTNNSPYFWTGTQWISFIGLAADAVLQHPSGSQEIHTYPLIVDAGLTTPFLNNVVYSQPGDTIGVIESSLCTTPCTYVVNQQQNFTLSANHTLSANVFPVFTASGSWNVTGAFTLTIPNRIEGSLNQHFEGNSPIKFGVNQPLVPVEWFGAVADGNQSGGGTDNFNAIQFCLTALTKGQCVLQTGNYRTTATLTIRSSNVGIVGQQSSLPSSTLYPTPSPSEIIISSPSADVIDVSGTSNSNAIAFNRFENFTIARSVAFTGTARGLSLSFVDGPFVSGVTSMDSQAPFYIHGMASQGEGVIERSVALWGANGITETTGGSMGGFVLDSSGGVTNNSARFSQDGTFSALPHSVSAAYTTYGFSLQGDQTHDAFVDKFESATTDYGLLISQNVGQGVSGSTDIHFTNMINDSCFVTCLKISQVLGSVEISGGWEANSVSATNTPVVEIDNSNSVNISHVDIYASAGLAGTPAVKADTDTLLRIENNNVTVLGTSPEDGISLTNDVGGVVQGNTVWLAGTGSTSGITVSAGTHGMVIRSNSVQGTATNGIIVASGSNGITGLGDNTEGATSFGTITNFLVNNGSNPIVLWAPGAPSGACNNPGELYMNSLITTGTFPDYQCKGTTWVGIGTAY